MSPVHRMPFSLRFKLIMTIIASSPYPDTVLDEIRRTLEKSRDLRTIKSLHDRIIAFLPEIRSSDLGRNRLHRAAELKLRIERKPGKILSRLHLRGGDHVSARAKRKLKLERLGISRGQSADWQLEALLPKKEFAAYLRQKDREGTIPSSHGLCCLARMYAGTMKLAGYHGDHLASLAHNLPGLAEKGKRFASIYVDCSCAPATTPRLDASLIDARLAQMPVAEIATFHAHLYLKVALESLGDGVKILAKWGFAFQALLILTETSLDPDGSCHAARRLLLLGSRDESGCPIHRLPHWMKGAGVLTVDSVDAVHRYITQRSPAPYLDLFGSQPLSKDWTMATPQ